MSLSQITFEFDDPKKDPEGNDEATTTKKNKNLLPENGKPKRGRKGLKNIHVNADLIEIPEDDILFSKKYYTIGTVARMFKVTGSLIRFWENEFEVLQPKKNGKGDRLFRPEDIKNLQVIYHLLREKKYTLEGAKEYFKSHQKLEEHYALIFALKKIKGFLLEIKSSL